MKIVFGVIAFAATALVVGSAPTLSEGQIPGMADQRQLAYQRQLDYYRDVRSQYPQYVSPCAAAAAAAASAPIPAIAPAAAYQVNISPYHGYPQASAQQQYYGVPNYRSLETEPHEIMSYSDMDHMMSEHIPMARYGYTAPAAPHPYSPVAASSTTGPVFGIFPTANSGGCNVPLLFSCTPSVVPGHMVQTQTHDTPPDAYRGVEPLAHHDSQESHELPAAHEHVNQAHELNHATVHQ